LQAFDPDDLRTEARDGGSIADALSATWGDDIVHRSDLGPMLEEQDVLARVLEHAGLLKTDIVPAEVTAAIGMILLRDHGVLTVNTHGAPGGRVSLRLKPTAGALAAVGGQGALVCALDEAVAQVADRLGDDTWFTATLFGETA
jgi:L-seryl-tRNA(Ser) seleniumtransferase